MKKDGTSSDIFSRVGNNEITSTIKAPRRVNVNPVDPRDAAR